MTGRYLVLGQITSIRNRYMANLLILGNKTTMLYTFLVSLKLAISFGLGLSFLVLFCHG